MPSYEWSCLIKDKANSAHHKESAKFEVTNHPLKSSTVSFRRNNEESVDKLDPLSAAMEGVDPLSSFAQETQILDDWHPFNEELEPESDENGSKAWKSRKNSILNKYTTLEKLSIVSSYLPGGEKMIVKQVSNVSEQVKHRLEQLDEFEEGSVRKTIGLTQQEYVARINILNSELVQAWNSEQRVKALKIAIQCSKLLADTSVMQFYPSKFVLVTDILDTFGNLVFERLKGKSYGSKDLPTQLGEVNPDLVPENAKETCQNWLYKMASIRELLPRLYIEMSLLQCYIFLSRNEFDSAIARLTRMIRGIGNPLVAAYSRSYLCRVAMNVLTKSRHFFYSNLQEFLQTYNQIFESSLKRDYEAQSINEDMYLSLYAPALDWLLYGTITYSKNTDTLLDELFEKSKEMQNKELLLYSLTSSFDAARITKKALPILEIITNTESLAMRHEILVLLGEHMCKVKQPNSGANEILVQTCWKLISNLKTLPHFLRVLEPWMEFASVHLSAKHVNVLLRGIIKYVSKSEDSMDDCLNYLQSVIKRMLHSVDDVEELFLLDGFMPLLDLLQSTPAQLEMSKMILEGFFARQNSNVIGDHIVIGNLMRLCRTIHDSMNALTVADEIKVASEVISKFVQSVSFHDDWEQQLTFYVECRSAFINLDGVLITLVYAVNRLSTTVGRGAGGVWLLRACAAYCFITIPSLQCPLLKAQLYLLSGQVALLNNCIGQAEACFKVSVSMIPDIPLKRLEDGQMKPTQVKVHALISNFLSTLLVMPDNVESNCKLYLLNGLVKAVHKLPWDITDPMYYTSLLLVLDLLCNLAQESYSYHIDSVVSNDLLYGSEKEFINEVENLATTISDELLAVLKQLGDAKQNKRQYTLSLELFWRVTRRGNMCVSQMSTLAVNLWFLAQKHQEVDGKFAKSLISALQNDKNKYQSYEGLLAKIKV